MASLPGGPEPIEVYESVAARDASLPTPRVGQCAMTFDDGAFLIYYGAHLGWCPPWNTAWGQQVVAELTANSATLPVYGDGNPGPTAGLSGSFLALPNRQYELAFDGLITSSANADQVAVTAHADTTVIQTVGTHTPGSIGQQIFVVQQSGVSGDAARFVWPFTYNGRPEGGVTLFYLSGAIYAWTGAGNANFVSNANGTTRMIIRDVGPAGGPLIT